jgi:NADPH:quinone reductase-like Zn-dependent oxidoreductase
MRAAIRKGILGYTFAFSQELPTPAFQPSSSTHQKDVLVKVNAAAINPVDYKLPRAALGPIIGNDFCGTITEIGSNVNDNFEVGDVVFGTAAQGSIAEYTIAKSDRIAKAPKGWKAVECAALPIAYQSALQCLRKGNIVDLDLDLDSKSNVHGNGKKVEQKSVLIIGASGGCGVAGLQLCKALGVSRIVAICSGKNDEFVRQHGATEVVDYTNQSELESFFFENSGKFDCVYDVATNSGGGEDYWDKSMDLLRRDEQEIGNHNRNRVIGEYTALNGPVKKWLRALAGREKENESIILMNSNTADLELVVELLDRIGARPLTNIMTFDDEGLQEAFELLKSRRTRGKIVFEVLA